MKALKELDFIQAANIIGCEVEVIKAVCEVEAPRGGFMPDGKPIILYEPFQFGDLTKHKYFNASITIDGIVYPLSLNRRIIPWSVKNAQYGRSNIQHQKLEAAKLLDPIAAEKACSWGKFQIMGYNHKLCGYNTLYDFVVAMYKDEGEHLKAFINFIKNTRLDDELREKRWEDFAFAYNGPKQDKGTAYKKDDYDYFLEQAYLRLKGAA